MTNQQKLKHKKSKTMKQIIILFTIFLFAMITFSCEKEELLSTESEDPVLKSGYNMTEHEVDPKFGRPNSTKYYFQVYDVSGINALSVKLYELASGKTTYLSMNRNGNLWILSTKISNNGWYTYRYVYSKNKKNISSDSYELCNTYNTFDSGDVSSITWPFGADGSRYNKRKGWISGEERGGCGSGHDEDGHQYRGCKADDTYAEDWNKNCGSTDDNGAEVRSPLDGEVIKVGVDKSSNHNGGYGNYVDISQETEDGEIFIFRIAHLKYKPPVSVDDYVRAGYTKIGNIGMSGGTSSSYHGHCVLYIENDCYDGVEYSFDAR